MRVKHSVCTVLGNLSHWIQQALPDKSDLGFVLVDYGHVRYKVLWLLLRISLYWVHCGMFNYCNSYQNSVPLPHDSSPLPIFTACISKDKWITIKTNNKQWFVQCILADPSQLPLICSVLELYIFLFVWTMDCGINIESKQPYRIQVPVGVKRLIEQWHRRFIKKPK